MSKLMNCSISLGANNSESKFNYVSELQIFSIGEIRKRKKYVAILINM